MIHEDQQNQGIYCPFKLVPACQRVHLQGEQSQNPLLSCWECSHTLGSPLATALTLQSANTAGLPARTRRL